MRHFSHMTMKQPSYFETSSISYPLSLYISKADGCLICIGSLQAVAGIFIALQRLTINNFRTLQGFNMEITDKVSYERIQRFISKAATNIHVD